MTDKIRFSMLNPRKKIIFIFAWLITGLGLILLITGGYLYYMYPYQDYLANKNNKKNLEALKKNIQDGKVSGKANTEEILSRGTSKTSKEDVEPLQFPCVIEIPKINLRWLVQDVKYDESFPCGINKKLLDEYGVCHYPATKLPGEIGVCAIAGHRVTHGGPFRKIDLLVKGDEIKLSNDLMVYSYEVVEVKIISPNYEEILVLPESGKSFLILTACHPPGSAKQRIAIVAILKGDE